MYQKALQYQNIQRAVWLLLACFGAFLALYLYFVNIAVFSAVSRTEIQSSIDKIYGTVLSLESSYLRATTKVDPAIVTSKGFTPIDSSRLHYVGVSDVALSYRSR